MKKERKKSKETKENKARISPIKLIELGKLRFERKIEKRQNLKGRERNQKESKNREKVLLIINPANKNKVIEDKA